MMPITNLERILKGGLNCPDGKSRIEFVCDILSGFFLEVSSKSPGVGTFYCRYRDLDGKSVTIKLGRTNDTSLAEARTKAIEIKEKVKRGEDPLVDLPRFKPKPTFAQFFEQDYMPHAKSHKRTWTNDQDMFNKELKLWFGDMRLDQIKRRDVESLHRHLKQDGRSAATADHYAKLMRHVLNVAVDWELLENNPLKRIKLFREDNRLERYLTQEELERLLHVLQTYDNRPVCEILMFLLFTGARRGEALQAKWQHIDLANRIWTIPSANSKSKKQRAIPLNDVAVEVLQGLVGRYQSEYIFLNSKTMQPYRDIKKSWYSIRKAAGLVEFRIHDLRHQHASMLVNAGRSLYEVQQILGHSSSQVTERYSHLQQSRLQSASESVCDSIRQMQNRGDSPRPALRVVGSGKN